MRFDFQALNLDVFVLLTDAVAEVRNHALKPVGNFTQQMLCFTPRLYVLHVILTVTESIPANNIKRLVMGHRCLLRGGN